MTNNKNEQKTLLAYQGSDIAFEYIEGKLMINATQMAKSFNKFPKDWLKTQQAKDLIGAVGSVNKILLTDLQLVRNGGENPGTWFQEDVALAFAQWLSPEFYVMCNNKLKELLLRENQPRELTATASPWQEETLITVPMGISVNQIWVKNGVIYARLNPLLRYIGSGITLTPDRVESIGQEHFRLIKADKKPTYFVNFAGFNGLLGSMPAKMTARTLCEIYRMFGIPDAEHDTGNREGCPYRFTDDEMHNILREANRRPCNRAELIDLLLNGKQEA